MKAGQQFRVIKAEEDFYPEVGSIVTYTGDDLLFYHGAVSKEVASRAEWSWASRSRTYDCTFLETSHLAPLVAAPKAPRKHTQQDTVLKHLKRRPYITDVQASGLYGIGQCAGVVFKLRKLGHNIETHMRQGVRATYAEYRLA